MVQTDALNRAYFSLFLASFELCETKRYSSARVSNFVEHGPFFSLFFFARARMSHDTHGNRPKHNPQRVPPPPL